MFQREARFRDLYEELVETNTTLPPATARLRRNACAPDYRPPATRTTKRAVIPDAFRKGNLVAGSLELALAPRRTSRRSHRYVEADRADWNRDPFTLVEENGYFYARGAVDDKAMAAAFIDAFVRFREEGFRLETHDQARAHLWRGDRSRSTACDT